MNPALYTRWKHNSKHGVTKFKIVGIWGEGFSCSYKVTAFEVKYEHKECRELITAARMESLIELNIIKPI